MALSRRSPMEMLGNAAMDNARTAPVPLFIRQMVVNAHVAGNVYQLGVVHLHFYLPGSEPEPSVGLLRDLNPFQACKALLEWYGTGRVRWERVIEKLVQLTPEPASEIIQHLTNLRKGTNRMPFEEVVQVAATVLLRSRKSRAFFEALPSGQKDLTLRTARRILHSDPESIRGMVQAITGTDPWLAAQLLPRSGHGEAALALVRALRPMDRMKIMTASPDWTRQFFLTDPVAPLRPLFAEWAREPRSAALIVKALEAHPQRAAVLLEVTSPELIYQVLGSINADGTRAAGILCFMPPSLAARVLSRYPGERELACLKKMPNIPKDSRGDGRGPRCRDPGRDEGRSCRTPRGDAHQLRDMPD